MADRLFDRQGVEVVRNEHPTLRAVPNFFSNDIYRPDTACYFGWLSCDDEAVQIMVSPEPDYSLIRAINGGPRAGALRDCEQIEISGFVEQVLHRLQRNRH